MTACGVIYLVTTDTHVEAARVSIWSLRRFYCGPITLFAPRNCRYALKQQLATLNVDIHGVPPSISFPNAVRYRKNNHCLMKTFANMRSPYEHTVFVDADTVIRGPIDPLFDCEVGFIGYHRLLVDNPYCTRRRNHVRKLRRHSMVFAPLVAESLRMNPPWPNTGVYSFQKNHPLVREWFYLAMAVAGRRVHDEIPLVLTLPRWKESVTWFDTRWNAIREMAEWDAAVIRHHVDNTWADDPEWRQLREQSQ